MNYPTFDVCRLQQIRRRIRERVKELGLTRDGVHVTAVDLCGSRYLDAAENNSFQERSVKYYIVVADNLYELERYCNALIKKHAVPQGGFIWGGGGDGSVYQTMLVPAEVNADAVLEDVDERAGAA